MTCAIIGFNGLSMLEFELFLMMIFILVLIQLLFSANSKM